MSCFVSFRRFRRIGWRLLVLATVAAACGTPEAPAPEAPQVREPVPYARADTVSGPHLFASGMVSTASPEFATAFSPDGRTVYFNRASDDRSVLQIYQSTFQDGQWTSPAPMPFSDGSFLDVDPFVSADGRRLYFSSTRSTDGTIQKDFDIWYVERTGTGWGEPVNPGAPLNGPGDEVFVTVSRNGTLYFSMDAPDGRRGIFRSLPDGNGFGEPEQLLIAVEGNAGLGNPCIAPNEDYLLLASGDLGGEGGADLFISYPRYDGTWTAPENLGPRINSAFNDFAPHLSPDGAYLFFTSERPGVVAEGAVEGRPPGDLYQAPWPMP